MSQTAQIPVVSAAARATARPAVGRWAPYGLAALFAVLSMRTAPCGNAIDSDAARHALNGAFIYDMARTGHIASPIAYGKHYYGRLPGVSLPYHPPLFPAVEAAFFAIFGVNLTAARLAVTLAVAISVLLYFKLIVATHGSQVVAAASVIAFFSWRWAQVVSNDVMLEMPALAFTLGAVYAARKLENEYPLRAGVVFALLSSAAVWTKQTTVFLGAVPFAYAALARRRRVFRGPAIWAGAALFAAAVAALLALSARFQWTGVEDATEASAIVEIARHNFPFYSAALVRSAGMIPAAIAAAAAAVSVALLLVRAPRSGMDPDAIYVSWAATAFTLLLILGFYDERYLFFVVAPLAALTFAQLERLGRAIGGKRGAALLAGGMSLVFASANLGAPLPELRGPEEAATVVLASGHPARVLYCGRTNGSFIFAVRGLDPKLETIVVRGDKLPAAALYPRAFDDFAQRIGLQYVVLERSVLKRPWDRLYDSPTQAMKLIQEIPQPATDPNANGTLRVFRYTSPVQKPTGTLKLHINRIGSDLEVGF